MALVSILPVSSQTVSTLQPFGAEPSLPPEIIPQQQRDRFDSLRQEKAYLPPLHQRITNWVRALLPGYGMPKTEVTLHHQTRPEDFMTHVNALCQQPRYFPNTEGLNAVADYIQNQWRAMGYRDDQIREEPFTVGGKMYKNVVLTLGPKNADRYIVGAHYDVFNPRSLDKNAPTGLEAPNDYPGADDNASGVAGLLELSRALKPHEKDLKKRVDVVAFTLEEPPNFGKPTMGSYQQAMQAAEEAKTNNANLLGMLCLEMIGYYSDVPGSQGYPLPSLPELRDRLSGKTSLQYETDLPYKQSPMRHVYGDKGNYVALMTTPGALPLLRQVQQAWPQADSLPVKTLAFPLLPGALNLHESDHQNYLKLGVPALMVTDTAYYRNPNYHHETDRPETLNSKRATAVTDAIAQAVLTLATTS